MLNTFSCHVPLSNLVNLSKCLPEENRVRSKFLGGGMGRSMVPDVDAEDLRLVSILGPICKTTGRIHIQKHKQLEQEWNQLGQNRLDQSWKRQVRGLHAWGTLKRAHQRAFIENLGFHAWGSLKRAPKRAFKSCSPVHMNARLSVLRFSASVQLLDLRKFNQNPANSHNPAYCSTKSNPNPLQTH